MYNKAGSDVIKNDAARTRGHDEHVSPVLWNNASNTPSSHQTQSTKCCFDTILKNEISEDHDKWGNSMSCEIMFFRHLHYPNEEAVCFHTAAPSVFSIIFLWRTLRVWNKSCQCFTFSLFVLNPEDPNTLFLLENVFISWSETPRTTQRVFLVCFVSPHPAFHLTVSPGHSVGPRIQ